MIAQVPPPPMIAQVPLPPMTVQVPLPPTIARLHKENYQHPHKYRMGVFNLFNLLLPKVLTMLLLLPKVLTILQQVVLFNRVVIPMDLQQLLHRALTVLQQAVQSKQVIPTDPQQLLLRALTVLQSPQLNPTTE